MRKGITPIISIIILLLITVGLAASAWTYMSNYMTSLTSKVIEMPTQKCVGGENVMAIVHNIGTQSIKIANDVVILEGDTALGGAEAVWCNLNETCPPGTEINTILSGGYGKLTIAECCGGTSGKPCPKTCNYDMIIGGRSQSITVYCPGQ